MITLTMRPIQFTGKGNKLTFDRPFQYEVMGMPDGFSAWVAEIDRRWQILRTIDGEQGHWKGEYANAEEALAGLREELVSNVISANAQ